MSKQPPYGLVIAWPVLEIDGRRGVAELMRCDSNWTAASPQVMTTSRLRDSSEPVSTRHLSPTTTAPPTPTR